MLLYAVYLFLTIVIVFFYHGQYRRTVLDVDEVPGLLTKSPSKPSSSTAEAFASRDNPVIDHDTSNGDAEVAEQGRPIDASAGVELVIRS